MEERKCSCEEQHSHEHHHEHHSHGGLRGQLILIVVTALLLGVAVVLEKSFPGLATWQLLLV